MVGIAVAAFGLTALGGFRIAGGFGTSPPSAVTFAEGPAVTPVDPAAVYDPVRAGEPLPAGFRRLLDRDRIRPVYDPVFRPGDESGWSDATLVIGVAGPVTARAYPVGYLNRREMVVDRLDGIPLLVSW